MAHSYSHLFNLPTTGLRFFTVYGPWGRPDMALFIFTQNILEHKPIDVFNYGFMQRDFTYVDDIVGGIIKTFDHPAKPNPGWDANAPDASTSTAPYRIFNIGRGQCIKLGDFVTEIENNIGVKAIKNYLPLQDGDVPKTWANIKNLEAELDYKPKVSVKEGIRNFINWYMSFYEDKNGASIVSKTGHL